MNGIPAIRIIAFAVVFLLALGHQGTYSQIEEDLDELYCYRCQEENTPECGEPFDPINIYLTSCPAHEGDPTDACAKWKGKNSRYIQRSCESAENCEKFNQPHIGTCRFCTTSLCNDDYIFDNIPDSSMTMRTALLPFLISIMVIVLIVYYLYVT